MEPLICPQCGGQITSYLPGQVFTTCQYCSTTFRIDTNKERDVPAQMPVYTPIESEPIKPQFFVGVLFAVLAVFGLIIFAAVASSTKGSKAPVRTSTPPATPDLRKYATPAATPNKNLLEFGGTGSGEGLFTEPTSITVDKLGRIYVADKTLRVQQFDEKGTYVKSLLIPANGRNYTKAKAIEKIRAAQDGKLYVNVGGVILIYDEDSAKPNRVIQVAPDYIQDFALRSDGGLLMISDDDKRETLTFVDRSGKFTRAIRAFHTNACDATISPQETAIEAIRLAVDGAGNIFSIYAFGSVSGYEISYNEEELVIVRFTPDGKYVNKFVPTMYSCGIEVDNQGRLYISDGKDLINIYTNAGQLVGSISGVGSVDAFALDKDNNVYILVDDKVIKRPAI